MPKKKYLINNIFLIIIFFLIFVFIDRNDTYKKIYNILNQKLEKRLVKVNGNCKKNSYGFLKLIEKKYQLKKNPKIINYSIIPNAIWSIYDIKKKEDNKPRIFLNYQDKLSLNFSKFKDRFISDKNIINTSGINTITFDLSSDINLNHEIEIYKIKDKQKISIYKEKINKKLTKNDHINIALETDLINSRWEPIYVKLYDLDEINLKKIKKITLSLKNKYQISDYEILEQIENCYFIK